MLSGVPCAPPPSAGCMPHASHTQAGTTHTAPHRRTPGYPHPTPPHPTHPTLILVHTCPNSSAALPAYAPGVSTRVTMGRPNLSAWRMKRIALRYPLGWGMPKLRFIFSCRAHSGCVGLLTSLFELYTGWCVSVSQPPAEVCLTDLAWDYPGV